MSDDKRKALARWKRLPHGRLQQSDITPEVLRINKALEESTDILITYHGGSESGRSRKILPLELFKKGGMLYLTAMCRVRSEERVFRLDRLQLPPEEGGPTPTRKTRTYTLGPSGTTTTSTPAPEPARPPERTAPPAAPPSPSPPPARPVAAPKTGSGGCLVLLLPLTILGTLTVGLLRTLVG